MISPEQAPQPHRITAESIHMRTGYALVRSCVPAILMNGPDSKALFRYVADLRERHGERNVLTSLYIDPDGEEQLGVFVRPRDKEPYVRPYDHIFDEASMGEACCSLCAQAERLWRVRSR